MTVRKSAPASNRRPARNASTTNGPRSPRKTASPGNHSHKPGQIPEFILPYPKNTPAIASDFDSDTPETASNREYHEGLIRGLRSKLDRVHQGGSEQSVKLHRSRGK